jgi:hypothetical protein
MVLLIRSSDYDQQRILFYALEHTVLLFTHKQVLSLILELDLQSYLHANSISQFIHLANAIYTCLHHQLYLVDCFVQDELVEPSSSPQPSFDPNEVPNDTFMPIG